ncbi:MAG: hypothetical protein OHK0039_30330 [Bacteroidia bacterium]
MGHVLVSPALRSDPTASTLIDPDPVPYLLLRAGVACRLR